MSLGTRGFTEEITSEIKFEDEVGVCQDKSQEQEDFRKKEMNLQDKM